MTKNKNSKTAEATKMGVLYASGLDIGTMFLQGCREETHSDKIIYNTIRNCYREIEISEDVENALKSQNSHYIKDANKIFLLGNDAYLNAQMAEFGSNGETEILKRSMKDGIINSESPKIAMTILRELERACLEKNIGKARENEILYFSVPANPIDNNSTINNSFHTKMAERYLSSLGFETHSMNEALAVIYSENPKMYTPDQGDIPFTGLGISFGAGMTNVCFSSRGVSLEEFSVCRGGDWIDQNVSKMTGTLKTKVLRIKEKKLNFDKINESEDDEIILALECYYDELIHYVFGLFTKRFKSSKGTLEHPIDLILSGGTASVPGFNKKVQKCLDKMDLPFKIAEIKMAKDMMRSVATGCYVRAKQAVKKATPQIPIDPLIG